MEEGKFKEGQALREENLKIGRHGGNKIQAEAGRREENSERGRHGEKNSQS
jgi:hypothetical protein